MKHSIAVVTCAMVIAATGSAWAGKPPLDPSQFKVGESTVADVEKVYGKPSTERLNSDGQHIIIYGRTHAHVKAASFVPVVGLFAGGEKGHADITTFTFDKDSKLKSFERSTTSIDCTTGVIGATCNN